MPVTSRTRGGLRTPCRWLILALALAQLLHLPPALAQPQADTPPAAGPTDGITWKTCNPPPICFRSKEARQEWGRKNHCQFLEDLCEGQRKKPDNQGAKPEDQAFWGDLWDGIKGGLVYGYEFVKGLMHGLKDQASDLWNMISNPGEVVDGLIELGKAFYNDPAGTLKQLAILLGQEVIDLVKRATLCGPYDLGKVIGQNISPLTIIRLARVLTKYGGKLADAVRAFKHDRPDCASFAAGTPVLTPQGMRPIEQIGTGQQVLSRHERLFSDAAQTVSKTFARTAPGYRLLTTESDRLQLTDEHPLWVQGKGWTPARHITDGDVIAGAQTDALVLDNQTVRQALPVYNFSVAHTASYFVGAGAAWAHNARCVLPYKAPKGSGNYRIGTSDGGWGTWERINRPDTAHYDYEKSITGAPKNVEYRVHGVHFDGYDSERKVLIDAKNYGSDNPWVTGKFNRIIEKDLEEARRQAGALEKARKAANAKNDPTTIEWHVANKEAAEKMDKLFFDKGIDVRVIFRENTAIPGKG